MSRYEVHGKDENEDVIVDAMRALGAVVHKIGRPLDLLVAIDGETGLCEVKTPRGLVRASQSKFMAAWPGVCCIARTPEQGVALVRTLRLRARLVRGGQ